MTFSLWPPTQVIAVPVAEAGFMWQLPTTLRTEEFYNDLIPEFRFDEIIDFNRVELRIRQAPQEEFIQDSVMIEFRKNGSPDGPDFSLITGQTQANIEFSPPISVGVGDVLRPRVIRVGADFAGIGLSIVIRKVE